MRVVLPMPAVREERHETIAVLDHVLQQCGVWRLRDIIFMIEEEDARKYLLDVLKSDAAAQAPTAVNVMPQVAAPLAPPQVLPVLSAETPRRGLTTLSGKPLVVSAKGRERAAALLAAHAIKNGARTDYSNQPAPLPPTINVVLQVAVPPVITAEIGIATDSCSTRAAQVQTARSLYGSSVAAQTDTTMLSLVSASTTTEGLTLTASASTMTQIRPLGFGLCDSSVQTEATLAASLEQQRPTVCEDQVNLGEGELSSEAEAEWEEPPPVFADCSHYSKYRK